MFWQADTGPAGEEKSFPFKARFRSAKNATVLRIFRRKRRKIQVPAFLQGLAAEIFFLRPPALSARS